ncbi:MAG: hypothetical protein CVU05_10640 [Bacteroidetes bacterium HGW-Bacteroidetes-21]|jgi:hypothetical protein|nr:MAG: hypothetical protein CVU05_10640 [Bacteroidetes bacterium HGW-Bacteroidetes-21]
MKKLFITLNNNNKKIALVFTMLIIGVSCGNNKEKNNRISVLNEMNELLETKCFSNYEYLKADASQNDYKYKPFFNAYLISDTICEKLDSCLSYKKGNERIKKELIRSISNLRDTCIYDVKKSRCNDEFLSWINSFVDMSKMEECTESEESILTTKNIVLNLMLRYIMFSKTYSEDTYFDMSKTKIFVQQNKYAVNRNDTIKSKIFLATYDTALYVIGCNIDNKTKFDTIKWDKDHIYLSTKINSKNENIVRGGNIIVKARTGFNIMLPFTLNEKVND